jgi:hypothetical protein
MKEPEGEATGEAEEPEEITFGLFVSFFIRLEDSFIGLCLRFRG